MPAFQRVLFPVDFSEQNRLIAPHVVFMARHYRAEVTLLHVMQTPTGLHPGLPEYGYDINFPAIREERRKQLDSFLTSEFEGVSTARIALDGDPALAIVEYAESDKSDLIMMPTHGYGPFRRFLLGSVAAKTLHDSTRPVWTCSHAPEARAARGYRNLLCAVSLGSESVPLLRWAAEFAREHGANLKLAHAIPGAKMPDALVPERDRFRVFLFDHAREELTKLQKEAGTNFEVVVEGGEVAHVVAAAARDGGADLVVIGRGILQHALGRMRTNVYSIIREAPCPVISI